MPIDALSYGPPTMDSLQAQAAFAASVELQTNPLLPAKINIDGKLYNAPTTVTLAPGQRKFSAITNIPDPNNPGVTFAFQYWQLNGQFVSNNATTIININGACTVTAQYMLGQSGWGAPAQPDSLPNPKGPMTPNLILENPPPKEV
jgi:hypothetical protein